MKLSAFPLLFLLTFLSISSLTAQSHMNVIPEPVSTKVKDGVFNLPDQVTIQIPNQREVNYIGKYLKNKLATATGYSIEVKNTDQAKADIVLNLNKKQDSEIGNEGYKLDVTQNQILITANEPSGLFYGVQTLLQLFPKEIESLEVAGNITWEIPNIEIIDYPRFEWRGLMLDVSRHFFTKEEVKQYIDAMSRYKYNVLHMHLTDDEGWRIEIKGYPRLTEVGAWNVKKVGNFGSFTPPTPDEPKDYGGFYTQEDIKELVAYAKDRFVNILPEIDVPGHSLATVVSYPELSCTPEANTYQVRSGEPIMDWSHGAPPRAFVDNTLCPANEKVYDFLDTVISQVAELFPFEYIHMGGDEAPINFWENNPEIKKLMKRENITDIHKVQGYFTKRVEKIVESKGKKFIGWDEILEGGISKNAAVMSWRGMEGGIEAAKTEHEVVMSPTTYAYLDYMQSDEITEPKVYSTLRLNKSYEFNPVPEGVDSKYIKGGQANLWTEQVYNIRQAEYMTWPRGLAIAESLWSPNEKKNWESFFPKVEEHFKRLKLRETKYSPSVYDPIFNVAKNENNKLKIILDTEVKGLDIYYSFDNSFPDRFYPKYTEPLSPPVDATKLRVITYKGKEPVGRMLSMPIEVLKKRLDKD